MDNFIAGFCVGLMLTAFLFVVILGARAPSAYQDEAIQHECAYYHPTTGEFTWK